MNQIPMPMPTVERPTTTPTEMRLQKRIKQREPDFTPEDIQEINEIRVEQRNLYYKYRFWVVGMVPYSLFLVFILLLNVREFAGPREDYPIFFYVALFLVGLLIVWAAIDIHKFAFDDEDTWLWKNVDTIARERYKKYKSMRSDQFGGLMKAVGMRGGDKEDK